jgi:hypothetical protein
MNSVSPMLGGVRWPTTHPVRSVTFDLPSNRSRPDPVISAT